MSRRYELHGRATQRLSIESSPYAFSRQLAFEPLESRRLLATFAVTNLSDGAVAAVGDLPGSLRQAVFDANATVGSDEILFDVGLSGSILLTAGELALTSSVTINGPGTDKLTIDAQQNSRIFNITAGAGDFSLVGLTLIRGQTTGDNGLFDTLESGGAVRSVTSGMLTLRDSAVASSRTTGASAEGGGIFATGDLTLISTIVSGNQTDGEYARGGGVFTEGTLTLSGSTINENLTNGNGAAGGGAAAIGNIDSNVTLVENNQTLGERSPGGGIFAVGDVSLSEDIIRDNSTRRERSPGGGLHSVASVTIARSTISGNRTGANFPEFDFFLYDSQGGGISASGDLFVDSSTVSGNVTRGISANGGGLYSAGDIELVNSTISGNTISSAGDVLTYGIGGQPYYTRDNTSNGGGLFALGSVVARHSTIATNQVSYYGGRGGGVAATGAINLDHTIVAQNSDNKSLNPDLYLEDSTLTAAYSLIGDIQGTLLDVGSPGTNQFNIDPMILPLGINGGTTRTHNLLPGSPAIDAGDVSFAAPPTEDQRGTSYARIVGGRIDIGAVEYDGVSGQTIVVNTLSDTIDSADGLMSLREALLVPANEEQAFVAFESGLAGGTIELELGELVIDRPLAVIGFQGRPIVIDAQQNSRVVLVTEDAGEVTLRDLTLTNGRTTGENGFFSDNTYSGGGLKSNTEGLLVLDRVTVSQNSTAGARALGGGIFSNGQLSITDSVLSGNASFGGSGGGLYASGLTTIARSSILNNTAGSLSSTVRGGGGVYLDTGGLDDLSSITDSVITGNIAFEGDGGGLQIRGGYSDNLTTLVDRTTFSGNQADRGGAVSVFLAGGNVAVRNSLLEGNSAFFGGGLFSYLFSGHSIVIENTTISGNSAGEGGGLHLQPSGEVNLRRLTVTENSATSGGGLWFGSAHSIQGENVLVASNFDTDDGVSPDLYTSFSTPLELRYSIIGITDNPASISGEGNLIGSPISGRVNVKVDIAAMGNFEAGVGAEIEDSYLFEYSRDGTTWEPLFTSSVAENSTETYRLANSSFQTLDDPLILETNLGGPSRSLLDNDFATLNAEITNPGSNLHIRFSATTDGGSEALAWRNLVVTQVASGDVLGRVASENPTNDLFASFVQADPDYTNNGDMFGIRSRDNPGIPGLPGSIADDSVTINPSDTLGIITESDTGNFFGVVDTVNGIGNDTNSATWTFALPVGIPIDPLLGPLADNGGPTLTHLPLAGSPAIDAGDPSFASPPDFDQRGNPFPRVAGGRIDIGSVEVAATGTALELVVVDLNLDQRQAYNGDGQITGTSDLDASNNGSRGVASSPDGTTLWVVDTDDTVYIYDGNGNLQTQWSFTGFTNAQGIATDGTDMWIVSNGSDDVHHFVGGATFTSGTHSPDSSFDLTTDNVNPFGITTDGNSLWVVNDLANQWKTFIYDLSGSLLGSWELDEGNRNARGITFDPTDPNDILIVNAGAEKRVYRYEDSKSLLTGSLTAVETILLDPFSVSPHGLGARAVAEVVSPLSADFNSNNIVDGLDFLTWQQNYTGALTVSAISIDLGAEPLPGDADQDGDVDADDLALWQVQYGSMEALGLPIDFAATPSESVLLQSPSALLSSAGSLDLTLAYESMEHEFAEPDLIAIDSYDALALDLVPMQVQFTPTLDAIYHEFGNNEERSRPTDKRNRESIVASLFDNEGWDLL